MEFYHPSLIQDTPSFAFLTARSLRALAHRAGRDIQTSLRGYSRYHGSLNLLIALLLFTNKKQKVNFHRNGIVTLSVYPPLSKNRCKFKSIYCIDFKSSIRLRFVSLTFFSPFCFCHWLLVLGMSGFWCIYHTVIYDSHSPA